MEARQLLGLPHRKPKRMEISSQVFDRENEKTQCIVVTDIQIVLM